MVEIMVELMVELMVEIKVEIRVETIVGLCSPKISSSFYNYFYPKRKQK
jgi:hypothetical protein